MVLNLLWFFLGVTGFFQQKKSLGILSIRETNSPQFLWFSLDFNNIFCGMTMKIDENNETLADAITHGKVEYYWSKEESIGKNAKNGFIFCTKNDKKSFEKALWVYFLSWCCSHMCSVYLRIIYWQPKQPIEHFKKINLVHITRSKNKGFIIQKWP